MVTASSNQGFRAGSVNVADDERKLSIAAGAALLIFGMTGMSMARLMILAAGGALAYRGLTGHCPLYEAMNNSGTSAVEEDDGESEEMDMERLAKASVRAEQKSSTRNVQSSPQAKK